MDWTGDTRANPLAVRGLPGFYPAVCLMDLSARQVLLLVQAHVAMPEP